MMATKKTLIYSQQQVCQLLIESPYPLKLQLLPGMFRQSAMLYFIAHLPHACRHGTGTHILPSQMRDVKIMASKKRARLRWVISGNELLHVGVHDGLKQFIHMPFIVKQIRVVFKQQL